MKSWVSFLLVVFALPATAQPFPSKPVRIIVGFGAGGGADVAVRIIAQGLAAQLGQPAVVENRPGAESTIAAEAVRSSPPDGYTILLGTNTAMVAVPTQRVPPPYDPFKDFSPISTIGRFTMFLVIGPGIPAKNVGELTDFIRKHPGQLNYASSNSAAQLAAVQLLMAGKLDMVHVRYKGDPQALQDLMTDRIQMMFTTGTTAPPLVKEGRIRALATLLQSRSPLLPEVPTAAEAGLQKLSIQAWAAFFGPAHLPAEIAARLSKEVGAALRRPEVREQLERQGFEGEGSTPEALAAFHRGQYDAWVRTVKDAGIKFE